MCVCCGMARRMYRALIKAVVIRRVVSSRRKGRQCREGQAWSVEELLPAYCTLHLLVPTRAQPTMAPSEAQPEAVTEAAPAAPLSEEEKKAAKRAEIVERLAAVKLQQQKESDQKTMYFGEHPGITCDGCGAVPLVGYRYKCKQAASSASTAPGPPLALPGRAEPPAHAHVGIASPNRWRARARPALTPGRHHAQCANHDVCENCYDTWAGGKMENAGKQVLSANATDHSFALHRDKSFKSLVKSVPGQKAPPRVPGALHATAPAPRAWPCEVMPASRGRVCLPGLVWLANSPDTHFWRARAGLAAPCRRIGGSR